FPEIRGFSARNLWDMKRLYVNYCEADVWQQLVAKFTSSANEAILRQPVAELKTAENDGIFSDRVSGSEFMRQVVAQIPWGHNLVILNKIEDRAAQLFYLHATAQNGWSRSILLNQIKSGAYERSVTENKTHNFTAALPEALAAQAAEMMKSRYNLEFLGIEQAVKERELETQLVDNLQRFLLELGYGFCFIGRQYRLVLGTRRG
ncbi:MAG: PDDEXK nuclease domain-containing protein, partial [Candidatus Paceibacterota bacterium]